VTYDLRSALIINHLVERDNHSQLI